MISDYGFVKIGNEEIPRIGMGTGALSPSYTWGAQSEKDSIYTIEHALDLGIRLIDTGESYGAGKTEEIVGKSIKKKRDLAFIATKISEASLEQGKIEEACDNSLKRLNVDYIDLYQIHWVNDRVNYEDVVEKLLLLKQKGKVKNLGLGNCGEKLQKNFTDQFITNQLPYSPIWRGIEFEILNTSVNTFIFYCCLGQGLLSGKYKDISEFAQSRKRSRLFHYSNCNSRHKEYGYENYLNDFLIKYNEICNRNKINGTYAALGWILARIKNSITLIGLRNTEQVNFLSNIELISKEITNEITEISDQLKIVIGNKVDLWDSKERIK